MPITSQEPVHSIPSVERDTLLIVDNNQTSVSILFEYLRENGFRVLVARDGESAVKRALMAQPDLILMDVLMPGMNGFEACRLIKENSVTHDIPVIFMTGLAETEDKMKGFAAGGVDYLTKPLQLTEVKARVITHLQLRRLVRELKSANDVLARRANYLEINRIIGEQISAILNLNELLEEIVGFIRAQFDYSYTGIWLVNDSGTHIDLMAYDSRGDRHPQTASIDLLKPSANMIAVACVIGQLQRREEPGKNEAGVALTPVIELAIPLKFGPRLMGGLYIQNDKPGRYENEENALLKIIGNQVAIAIRNAQLYQAERQRLTEIEAAHKELEMFSYSVSHDLRAPLRSITGFNQILLEDYLPLLPEDGQTAVEKISANASRMTQLIDDILTFSRFIRQPLNKTSLLPAEIILQVMDDLKPEIANRQINLKMGELPLCQADPSLLKQVWANLLSNAYKYTRNCPMAEIEIGSLPAHDDQPPVYFIKDNGVGFDMQYADKLFGVFQRLHSPQEFEGTGVGLAIVRRIIERHGGKIWVEAQINQGAAFYFILGK